MPDRFFHGTPQTFRLRGIGRSRSRGRMNVRYPENPAMKLIHMLPSRTSLSVKRFISALSCLAVLMLCPLVYGQISERSRSRNSDAQENSTAGLSELAKD